jgi:hypothetical protein
MIKEVKTKEELDALASKSAPTWEGLALEGLEEQIKAIDDKVEIVYCEGKTYNEVYHLTGNNAYPDDLHIVFLVTPEKYDLKEMMKWKLQYGCRWADDVKDNNLAREMYEGDAD